LGGSGDLFVDGQVSEEGFDLRDAHLIGVAFVVEEDEAFDPMDIGLFGAVRIRRSVSRTRSRSLGGDEARAGFL